MLTNLPESASHRHSASVLPSPQSVKVAFIEHSREADPITTPPRSPISLRTQADKEATYLCLGM